MIRFDYPELFLLAIPLWFAYRRWGRAAGVTGWLRLAIVGLLLLSLTGPRLNLGGLGLDVIVVADRSRSMPAGAGDSLRELIRNLQRNRGPGDRIGVVTFGSRARVEQTLSEGALLEDYTKEILPDGSDLNDAVRTALNLVDENRPARILVLSDGEANGGPPDSAARRARERGVPVDYRLYERLRVGDTAIESVLLPRSVSPRAPFQFSVRLHADRDAHGTVRVLREGQEIAARETDLTSGTNRLLFRDLLEEGGLHHYRVELDVPGDPLTENNRGAGVVRVEAGPRVLVLNTDGAEGNLTGALRSGRIPVDTAVAGEHPLTQDALDPYRAVVLENVPARDLNRVKMERLAQFVEDLGGGLMLTGGQRSFGTGGYYQSPLDPVLPVSMEMREEHRKTRLALAVALDRSGSMGVPVQGSMTKMDLANLGTAECVRLLSAGDSVAVIAVDSSPHVVQELIDIENPDAIASRIQGIESGGGGIFVYEALVAAGRELAKAEQATKHIILFSDAADSERPRDYKGLIEKFRDSGITVSVIGLGTRADRDAGLLEDIAKRGEGNIMFTEDPQELPRLFTEDTMSVARSSFIEADPQTQPNGIPGRLLSDARLLGELQTGGFPAVDGYNLSYLKPDATAAVVSQDEYDAPLSAFWYRGLGRVGALTLEVDGQYTGRFASWEHYADFLVTHVRWLMSGGDPGGVYTDVARDGQDGVVTVELDPERRDDAEPPEVVVVPPGVERTEPRQPDLVWTGPHTLQARFRMERTGTYRTLVKTGPRAVARGPALTLPYSPEFVPRAGLPAGHDTLAEMAELSGGTERTDVLQVLADPPRSPRMVSLLPWLFVLGIVLLIVEIAGRRLSLWERLTEAISPETAGQPRRASWLPQWKLRVPSFRRRTRPVTAQTDSSTQLGDEEPVPQPAETSAQSSQAEGSSKSRDVFAQAKSRAKRRGHR